MQKKTVFALLAILTITMPAFAIDLPKDATPAFSTASTAYSSSYQFNDMLEAYGLKMDPEGIADVPTSYAKLVDNKVVFNNNSAAYTPVQYHGILSAYGLVLIPEDVNAKLAGLSSYAKASGEDITFGKTSTAYSRAEWSTILGAYSHPIVPTTVVTAAPEPGDADGDGVTDDMDLCPGTPKGIAVGEKGCWALTNALLFDFGSANLKDESHDQLDYLKEAFDAHPDMNVTVVGHTDSTGPENYNQILSENRAKAVVKYLVNSVGIAADRLTAAGVGEVNPDFPNDTKENRAKNRRVVFHPTTM